MSRKREKGIIDCHIQAYDGMITEETNPEFKGELQKQRDLLMISQFTPEQSKNVVIENTHDLIESGKQIQNEIQNKKQQLQEDCSGGNELACAELEQAIDCTHCDDVDMLFVDLAQDQQFAECFDDVFPLEERIEKGQAQRKAKGEERNISINEDGIETYNRNQQMKQKKQQQLHQQAMESDDPFLRDLAEKQLNKRKRR